MAKRKMSDRRWWLSEEDCDAGGKGPQPDRDKGVPFFSSSEKRNLTKKKDRLGPRPGKTVSGEEGEGTFSRSARALFP